MPKVAQYACTTLCRICPSRVEDIGSAAYSRCNDDVVIGIVRHGRRRNLKRNELRQLPKIIHERGNVLVGQPCLAAHALVTQLSLKFPDHLFREYEHMRG